MVSWSGLPELFVNVRNFLTRRKAAAVAPIEEKNLLDKLNAGEIVLHKTGEVTVGPIGDAVDADIFGNSSPEKPAAGKVRVSVDLVDDAAVQRMKKLQVGLFGTGDVLTHAASLFEITANLAHEGRKIISLYKDGETIIAALDPRDGGYIEIKMPWLQRGKGAVAPGLGLSGVDDTLTL